MVWIDWLEKEESKVQALNQWRKEEWCRLLPHGEEKDLNRFPNFLPIIVCSSEVRLSGQIDYLTLHRLMLPSHIMAIL